MKYYKLFTNSGYSGYELNSCSFHLGYFEVLNQVLCYQIIPVRDQLNEAADIDWTKRIWIYTELVR